MGLYLACFCIGFFGLLGMAMLGMGHHAHIGHHSHVGHTGAMRGHAGAARGGKISVRSTSSHGTGRDGGRAVNGLVTVLPHDASHQTSPSGAIPIDEKGAASLLAWISPRVLLSLCLGFGATGMLMQGHGPASLILPIAAVGALAFEMLGVSPMWNFFFRFASEPARTLETAVFEEAIAVTNFDSSGSGLISIDLDGQHIQVLGNLSKTELVEGQRVLAGDRLFIQAVDARRNSCTVSASESSAVAQ